MAAKERPQPAPQESTVSTSTPTSSVRGIEVIRVFEILLIVGMIFMVVGAVGALIDKPGLDLYGTTLPTVDAEIGSMSPMSGASSRPNRPTTAWSTRPPAKPRCVSVDPVTAQLTFPTPTSSQRVVWVIWTVVRAAPRADRHVVGLRHRAIEPHR